MWDSPALINLTDLTREARYLKVSGLFFVMSVFGSVRRGPGAPRAQSTRNAPNTQRA